MKTKTLLLAFVVLVLREAEARAWETYTSKAGRFSVQMPGKPKESAQQVPTPAGAVNQSMATAESGGLGYLASWTDFPVDEKLLTPELQEKLLDGGVQGAVSQTGGKLLEQSKIKLGGYPGRECRLQAPDGTEARNRIYLVGKRLIMLVVTGKKGTVTSKDADKFLGSLQLDGAGNTGEREARRLREEGTALLKQGEYQRAVARFTQSIDLDPNDALTYNERGVAYTYLDRDAEAIKDFSQVIKLNDQSYVAYRSRGSAYFRQGKLQEALDDLTRAIELNTKYARAYQARGDVYTKLGKPKEAQADYQTAKNLEAANK